MQLKFLIDAQLPPSLCKIFIEQGFEVLHTSQLANGNQTTDKEIGEIAAKENFVVISKDIDFWDSCILKKQPPKLILVKSGNTSKNDLINLFKKCLPEITHNLLNNDSDIIILKNEGVSTSS
ncbi:MAG: DUF5615 family PIN-like protein [Raineya sp.]|nr:DUF5615 family PIN-like protein [Raineya sp.]MDW8295738.1 DUF5615 family PIN-like protein [Raineya sp.]